MDINYFSKTRILDGGMGQELLRRGMTPQGTLWSASALIDKKYHPLVVDTHLDFINAGADVIVTTTFTARRIRLIQHKCEEHFEYVNTKAVELALKARDISKKNILVAGGLPNQYQTYSANLGDDLNKILKKQRQSLLDLDKEITGFNVGINAGVDAGQTIMHCHIHLIPRRKGNIEDPRVGIRGVIPYKQKYIK